MAASFRFRKPIPFSAMTVLSQRQDVSRALRRSLDANSVIVAAPDHPLLIEAPDILVADKGGLLAIYFPKAAERSNAQRLYTRFVLGRLALPPQTRHVLVHDHRVSHPTYSFATNAFAAVLSSRASDIEDLAKIARDPSFGDGRPEIPAEVLIQTRRRYAEALGITQVARRLARTPTDKTAASSGRSSGPYRFGTSEASPTLVHEADISGREWRSADIQQLAIRTTRTAFALDNGVPHLTGSTRYGVALIDEFRDFRGDPDKTLRAAAFAGWVLAPRSQEQRLPALVERLLTRNS